MHQNLFQKDENARLLIATLLKYRDAGLKAGTTYCRSLTI